MPYARIFSFIVRPGWRVVLLGGAGLAVLSMLLHEPVGDRFDDRLWQAGKAAWWDARALDLGLTGWGHAPEQPIAFSHALHAGEYGLECLYCHSAARVSPAAHVPPVAACIGCHAKPTDNPEIEKLQTYWKNRESIPWVRVHALPAFTRFNHKRHVRAGVECQACHGEVQRMARVEQVSSLKMGWCVSCHDANQASKDCLVCHY